MICKECGLDQEKETQFYKTNQSVCKPCLRERYRKYHQSLPKKKKQEYAARHRAKPESKERQRRYYREWYKKNGRKRPDNYIDQISKWKENNANKKDASVKLRRAIKAGKIHKPSNCTSCNREARLHGHHFNYLRPLEVIWLCASCHKTYHEEPNRDLHLYLF